MKRIGSSKSIALLFTGFLMLVISGARGQSFVANNTITAPGHSGLVLDTCSIGDISGPSVVCESATINLTDTTGGGVWSSSNDSALVIGGTVTGLVACVDTIFYSVTTGCGILTAIQVITVNPLPIVGVISGPPYVCVAGTITMADTTTGGAWSTGDSTMAIVDNSGVVSGIAYGNLDISYTVTNSCGSSASTLLITVNPLPEAGSISGTDSLCPGDTLTLKNSANGGTWGSTDTRIATIFSEGLLTGISHGTDTILYTVRNVCGTAVARYPVKVGLSTCPEGVTNITEQPTNTMTVYPNLNRGSFTVYISAPVNEESRLIITNMMGEKVKEIMVATNQKTELQIDVPSAIYYLSAITRTERMNGKVVVE